MPEPSASELFSLKEWMAAISAKLDRLETKLDAKAEMTTVQAVELRVAAVEQGMLESTVVRTQLLVPQMQRLQASVERLGDQMARVDAVEDYKRWIWGIGFAALLSVAWNVINLVNSGMR